MVWRRSCLVLSHVWNTKDLVSIETFSSLFLSLSTGGGWKRFWDGQNFLFEPMKEFCHVWWWLCFVCCSASDWGPSFSLFWWCARKRAPPVCGMKDVCGSQDDMPHTTGHLTHETKVRQEGEEDKMNDSRQGQRRKRPKWLSLEGHQVLDLYLCEKPCLWFCLSPGPPQMRTRH